VNRFRLRGDVRGQEGIILVFRAETKEEAIEKAKKFGMTNIEEVIDEPKSTEELDIQPFLKSGLARRPWRSNPNWRQIFL